MRIIPSCRCISKLMVIAPKSFSVTDLIKIYYIEMKRIILILSIILVLCVGCRHSVDSEALRPLSLEEYKAAYKWIGLDDQRYVSRPFSQLGIDSMTYDEVYQQNGIPVMQYYDTVVDGFNIVTKKTDFDLYPLTVNRDTVVVLRCWWMKSFHPLNMLYVVFEINKDVPTPIYGYMYDPGKMPRIGDNYSRGINATSR